MNEQQLEAVEEAIGMLMMIASTIRLEEPDPATARLVSHLVSVSLLPDLERAAVSLRIAFPDTSQAKTTERALGALRAANERVRRALGEGPA